LKAASDANQTILEDDDALTNEAMRMRAKIVAMQVELDASKAERKSLRANLNQEVRDESDKIDELQADNNRESVANKELQQTYALDHKELAANLKQEVVLEEDERQKLESVTEENRTLGQENSVLTEEAMQMRQKVAETQQQLRGSLTDHVNDLADERQKMVTAETVEERAWAKDRSQLTSQLKYAKSELKDADEEIQEVQMNARELVNKTSAAEAEAAALRIRTKQAEEAKTSMIATLHGVLGENAKDNKKIAEYKQNLTISMRENAEYMRNNTAYEQNISLLKREKQDDTKALQRLKKEIDQKREELLAKKNIVQRNKTVTSNASAKINSGDAALDSSDKNETEMSLAITHWQQKATGLELEKERMIETLQQSINLWKQKANRSEEEKATMVETLQQFAEAKDMMSEKAQNAMQEASEYRQTIEHDSDVHHKVLAELQARTVILQHDNALLQAAVRSAESQSLTFKLQAARYASALKKFAQDDGSAADMSHKSVDEVASLADVASAEEAPVVKPPSSSVEHVVDDTHAPLVSKEAAAEARSLLRQARSEKKSSTSAVVAPDAASRTAASEVQFWKQMQGEEKAHSSAAKRSRSVKRRHGTVLAAKKQRSGKRRKATRRHSRSRRAGVHTQTKEAPHDVEAEMRDELASLDAGIKKTKQSFFRH